MVDTGEGISETSVFLVDENKLIFVTKTTTTTKIR